MPEPSILRTEECPSDAKWLKLEKIHWKDQGGKERIWEVANRKTRTEAGVDSEFSFAFFVPPSSRCCRQDITETGKGEERAESGGR